MGLYHFFWKGKERTVSVNRLGDSKMSLMFLDQDIVRNVNAHLLIEKTATGHNYLNEKEIVSLPEADDLVVSIGKLIRQPSISTTASHEAD